MAETKARFLANLIGADNTANDFTLPNVAVSGTDKKVLTSGGDGTVTWEETLTAPEFISMSGSVNEDDQTTLTINGSQFISGMTADVYNNSNIKLNTTALTANLVSSSQITVDIPNDTSTNGFPIASGTVIYLKLIKSGLSVDTSNITVNADPVWGSVNNPHATQLSGDTGNVGSALTEPTISSGSGTITYSIATQPSDGVNKYAINSSRQISVDSTSNSGQGNVYVSTTSKTDAIAVRATGPAGSAQASDLAVNILIYKYPFSAAGTIVEPASYTGDYRSHTFLSGTTSLTVHKATTVDILIVGGGGAGSKGTHGGAGGGAGGMRVLTSHSMPAGTYSIVVGAGGASSSSQIPGDDGDPSSITQTSGSGFATLSATGGGGAGVYSPSSTSSDATLRNGRNGGSGGGGAETYNTGSLTSNTVGGTGDGSVGTDGNTAGYYGGNGGYGNHSAATRFGAGGGGGAGANGSNSSTSNHTGGAGGNGLQNNFRDGTLVYYAGGGGGNGDNGGGAGGNGGGGTAPGGGSSGDNGDANTGGGGSGAGSTSGTVSGAGGSGIVVIRYQFS